MKKLVEPVIVIPGITATYLRDEYPVGQDMVWAVLKENFERIALHPNNLKFEALEPARVKPGQIFEIAYKELIEELRYNLREKEDQVVPVFPFGYDWRMPLEEIEDMLDLFIQEVIERTKLLKHYNAQNYGDNPKVNLIGHSMGGLIVTGYLARYGKKAPINKVVTLATPFRGSFEAVMKISTGMANLGTSNPSSRERETARITPALYYLIPSFRNGITYAPGLPESLFDPGAWQPSILASLKEFIRLKGLPNQSITPLDIFSSLLQRARSHSDLVENFKLEQAGLDAGKWLAVVGVNSETRVKLNIIKRKGEVDLDIRSGDRLNQWGDKKESWRMTGDGTVPFEGAVPPFLGEENLVCVTPQDYGYWELQDMAVSKLAGFHGILPNMNMLHRMIVRFLKDLDDTRGNTWGYKAPEVTSWNPPMKFKDKSGTWKG